MRLHRPRGLVILFVAGIVASPCTAEVLDAASDGFTLRQEIVVPVDRDRAYTLFTRNIGQWWNPDHTVSGDASLLTLDPRPMGCFCEMTGAGNGVVHMIVTLASAPSMLRLTGGLGPLGLGGVNGNLTVEFLGDDKSSRVVLHYSVGGYHPEGLDELAPAVDAVLADALRRLLAHSHADDGER